MINKLFRILIRKKLKKQQVVFWLQSKLISTGPCGRQMCAWQNLKSSGGAIDEQDFEFESRNEIAIQYS